MDEFIVLVLDFEIDLNNNQMDEDCVVGQEMRQSVDDGPFRLIDEAMDIQTYDMNPTTT